MTSIKHGLLIASFFTFFLSNCQSTVSTTEVELHENAETAEPTLDEHQAVSKIAANYLSTQTRGDVEIQLIRVFCEDKDVFLAESGIPEPWFPIVHGDVPTLCLFFVGINNTAPDSRRVYPDRGTIQVGNQHINLADVRVAATGLAPIREDVLPNSHHVIAFWFGVPQMNWNEIGSMVYVIPAPLNSNGSSLEGNYQFEIDTTGWNYEDLPEELAPLVSDWNVRP